MWSGGYFLTPFRSLRRLKMTIESSAAVYGLICRGKIWNSRSFHSILNKNSCKCTSDLILIVGQILSRMNNLWLKSWNQTARIDCTGNQNVHSAWDVSKRITIQMHVYFLYFVKSEKICIISECWNCENYSHRFYTE